MESINVEKIQALRRYKKQQFMNTLMFYPIVALSCGILCTIPFWLPCLYSSIKTLLCVHIPAILSFFFNVKSLFIIGNLIVMFLLGESKIQNADKVEGGMPKMGQKQRVPEAVKVREQVLVKKEEGVSCLVDEDRVHGSGSDEEALEDLEGEGEYSTVQELSTDELNTRADDFIARVNKQIRFEADHDLLCSC